VAAFQSCLVALVYFSLWFLFLFFFPAEILETADLNTLSSKQVRLQLEGEFKVDLTSRKKEVDTIVLRTLEEVQAAREKAQKKVAKANGDRSGSASPSKRKAEASSGDKKKKFKSDETISDEDGGEADSAPKLGPKVSSLFSSSHFVIVSPPSI